MSVYGFRDNKLKIKEAEVSNHIVVQPTAVSGTPVYLFLGTAGQLCISSTAPVSTSGVFANIGNSLGTVA